MFKRPRENYRAGIIGQSGIRIIEIEVKNMDKSNRGDPRDPR